MRLLLAEDEADLAEALGVRPDATAGHSLGEFSALVVAGALSFEDGLKLVSKRAMAMQAACEVAHAQGVLVAAHAQSTEGVRRALRAGVDTIEHALDEGFEFVAMARALLRDPQLVNKFQAESVDEGLCIHCNKCMPTIFSGARCVLVERV